MGITWSACQLIDIVVRYCFSQSLPKNPHWSFPASRRVCIPLLTSVPFLPRPIIDANRLGCQTWLELSASGWRPVKEWSVCFSSVRLVRSSATGVCVRMQLYLRFRWLALVAHWRQMLGRIRGIKYDSNHFTFPRTEQMERAIQWIKHNERGIASGRVQEQSGENSIWQGFVQGRLPRWWT